MNANLIENIVREKNLFLVNNIENLDIYERISDYSYKDVIGFHFVLESMTEWKEIEGKFISEVENIISTSENEFSVEPYLIFFIDKDKYFECLEDIVKIERDEFYCRKFVYPIGNEENIIEKLPFGSPLTFKTKRQNFISAEKTLVNLGFDRNKAQILTRKAISDQMKEQVINYFRNFELKNKNIDSTFKDNNVKNFVRLKEMQIQGFRIYGKNEVFDLDADLVVLYGANGLGKTSFFDAFEYGVTEEIKRFSNKEDKSDIAKLIKNFAVEDNDSCKVKIKFEVSMDNGTKDYMFERIMGKARVELLLPGGRTKKEETREILKEMTQKNIYLKKDEIVKLFRATHINNQGDSELTQNVIKGNSVISNEILGKMVSFEDYTDLEDNLDKIIKKNNEKMKNELENDLKNIVQKGAEFKQLYESQQNILQNRENSETLLNLENELKIMAQEKLNITLGKMEQNYIENELVSKIEAEFKRVQIELSYTQEALQIQLEFIRLKAENDKLELEKTRFHIKHVQNDLIKTEQQKNELELQKENSIIKLKEREKTLIECDRFLEISLNLNTISRNIEEYGNIKEKTILEIVNLQNGINAINSEESLRREELLKIDHDLYHVREEIQNIEGVYIDYDKYIKEKERMEIILVNEGFYLKEIEEILIEKEKINLKRSRVNARISNLESEIDLEKTENGELETLLFALKKHVNGNCCPVCNTVLKKQHNILEIIDGKLNNISNIQKSKYKQLENLKYQKMIKQKQYIDINNKMQNIENYIDELVKEKIEIELNYEKFILKIIELNLEICSKNEIETLLIKKQTYENTILAKLKKSSALGKDNEGRFENLQKKLNRNKAELSENNNNILTSSNLLDSWNKEFLKLENLQLFNQINFKDSLQKFNLITKTQIEIDIFKSEILKLNEKISFSKKNIEAYLKDLIRLNKELEDDIKINNDYKYVESQLLLMRDAKNIDIDNLDMFYKKLTNRLSTLISLKSKVYTFLKMIEFESLSTEQKELEQKIEINKREIEYIKKEIDNYGAINEKIKEVRKEIKAVQHNIVKNYCKNVEPLVSIIQNRLRALYGFSDLGLSLDEGSDEVSIKTSHYALRQKDELGNSILGDESTNKNELKPYQYLSEAQKNIINLSLFLSNTLSQNWSGFKTIFLDDPIQHFDDLNAYAFVELLKSLILDNDNNDNNEKKQIIISTCDNRFFSLIKEKFSLLKKKGRVKYYVFESMTMDGPVIKPLQ